VSGGVRARVLVVDDDPSVREVLARMLQTLGCEVVEAGSATEAVSAFLAGSFDMITLDYKMPGLDGAELHKVLSQEFGAGKRTSGFAPRKLPPIAIITGHADEPALLKAQFGEGVVGVLRKPVLLEDLTRLVEGSLRPADPPPGRPGRTAEGPPVRSPEANDARAGGEV